jgi:tRNA(Arg) A34 adenosine deaminase TadA
MRSPLSLLAQLPLSYFSSLGKYAAAGQRATELALTRAAESAAAGRIPIAGAAVVRLEDGSTEVLKTVCEGCNNRIPGGGEEDIGYPTDHGETSALRSIQNFAECDWENAVFATTLSPCVMCTRSLVHLHGLGLRRVVIAEAESFSGRKDLLTALPGMQLVELTNEDGIKMMDDFARTYPWDWAADIGEIPPAGAPKVAPQEGAWDMLREQGEQAAVVAPDGTVVATAADRRKTSGGNPVESAAMRAFGMAGSAINLREHTLVMALRGEADVADVDSFGLSSLGACELFRPLAVVFDIPVCDELRQTLTEAGVEVYTSSSTDSGGGRQEQQQQGGVRGG